MSELDTAISEMWRGLNALRLEVPASIADDVAERFKRVLAALPTPDEVDEMQFVERYGEDEG